jgi:fructokinase
VSDRRIPQPTITTPVVFGEVLFDRFPDGRTVLGGAPLNVAWNLQALGMPPLLITRVGDDEPGRRVARAMAAWGLSTAGLQIDPKRATGAVEVTITDGEPHYEILADRAWDHIAAVDSALPAGSLLYHGTLALRGAAARDALQKVRRETGGDIFVDVNLRPPWWDREAVLADLRRARWAKLNDAELAALAPETTATEHRAARLLAAGGLEGLVVTQGAAGATFHGADGTTVFRPAVTEHAVVDTVGAGDAFSAVTLLGLAHGWPWPLILERAQQMAGAVVGLRGATTTDRAFYRSIAAVWE